MPYPLQKPKLEPFSKNQHFNEILVQRSVMSTPVQEQKPIRIRKPSFVQPRQTTEVKESQKGISELSGLAQEMKKLLEVMPENSRLSKSVAQRRISKTKKRKHNVSFGSNKNYIISAYGPRTESNRRTQKSSNLGNVQQFFEDFHKKSKMLLKQLESNVFGQESL